MDISIPASSQRHREQVKAEGRYVQSVEENLKGSPGKLTSLEASVARSGNINPDLAEAYRHARAECRTKAVVETKENNEPNSR